jgi:hypothetical protein
LILELDYHAQRTYRRRFIRNKSVRMRPPRYQNKQHKQSTCQYQAAKYQQVSSDDLRDSPTSIFRLGHKILRELNGSAFLACVDVQS